MEIKVHARWQKINPRKVRPVIDVIRRQKATLALAKLSIIPKQAAKSVRHLLKSALAAAGEKNLVPEDLIIKEIYCNEGSKLKRRRYCARGRASMVTKKMSHITLILADKKSKKPKTKNQNLKTHIKNMKMVKSKK